MFRSSLEPLCSHRPISRLTTIAAAATPIITAVGDLGLRIRAIASQPMNTAITTSETALASAAKMPTRW